MKSREPSLDRSSALSTSATCKLCASRIIVVGFKPAAQIFAHARTHAREMQLRLYVDDLFNMSYLIDSPPNAPIVATCLPVKYAAGIQRRPIQHLQTPVTSSTRSPVTAHAKKYPDWDAQLYSRTSHKRSHTFLSELRTESDRPPPSSPPCPPVPQSVSL